MGKTAEKASFTDRAKGRGAKISRICGVCEFLADLPDGYRDEVVNAMSRVEIPCTAIFDELVADDYEPPGLGSMKRHRNGQCQDAMRRTLLGESDGVLR